MPPLRKYSLSDHLCIGIDQGLRAILGNYKTTNRPSPAKSEPEPNISIEQRKHSAALMRINHAGEVCAQALYHGQGLVSRRRDIREKMQQAALEEGDHLAWCHSRISELSSHTSYLGPFWYAGSFAIGLAAGLAGDKWSLGFLAETENQVVKHLEQQLQRLPKEDQKSYKILQQMQHDEAIHRDDALDAGAARLPALIKKIMKLTSGLMVKITYWI